MFLPSPKVLLAGLAVITAGTTQQVATAHQPKVEPIPAPAIAQSNVVLPSEKGVSQDYGAKNPELYGNGAHDGIDMKNGCGDPVKSPTNGRVTGVAEDDVYGTHVWVTGYDGWRHLFGHTGSSVKIGDSVVKGTVLGTTNSTGHSTACHLHWTTVRSGKITDPKVWIKEPEVCPHLFGVPAEYGVVICEASTKYGADPSQVAAILWVENRGFPEFDKFVSSHAGAEGIMQFMPATWERYKVDGDGNGVPEKRSWKDQIHSGAHLIGKAKKSVREMAIEYNAGPSRAGLSDQQLLAKGLDETVQYIRIMEGKYNEFRR